MVCFVVAIPMCVLSTRGMNKLLHILMVALSIVLANRKNKQENKANFISNIAATNFPWRTGGKSWVCLLKFLICHRLVQLAAKASFPVQTKDWLEIIISKNRKAAMEHRILLWPIQAKADVKLSRSFEGSWPVPTKEQRNDLELRQKRKNKLK